MKISDLFKQTQHPKEVDDFLYNEQDNEAFPGARRAVMDFLEENNCFDYLESIRGTPYLKRFK